MLCHLQYNGGDEKKLSKRLTPTKMSSLPPVPVFYHEEPRASFFSHIMADRFNKVGNGCEIIIR